MSRLRELRRHFLPRAFSPTGAYTPRQFDLAIGYRLLAHAEIEACLEEIATDAAARCVREWKSTARIGPSTVSLVAYSPTDHGVPSRLEVGSRPDLHSKLENAHQDFSKFARRTNHGIREHDVLRLLFPVGIREANINRGWIQKIDEFGQGRGEFAHRAGRALQPIDPQDDYRTVTAIAEGIREIDALLTAMKYHSFPLAVE